MQFNRPQGRGLASEQQRLCHQAQTQSVPFASRKRVQPRLQIKAKAVLAPERPAVSKPVRPLSSDPVTR